MKEKKEKGKKEERQSASHTGNSSWVQSCAIFKLLFVNERESTDKVVVTHISATP